MINVAFSTHKTKTRNKNVRVFSIVDLHIPKGDWTNVTISRYGHLGILSEEKPLASEIKRILSKNFEVENQVK